MSESDYEAGIREGRIKTCEQLIMKHADRMDNHERRLQMQERITYGLIGAIALANFLPDIKRILLGD